MNRYLRNADYYRFIKKEHLEQLTEGDTQLIADSEDDARDEIISNLTNEYEIEDAFLVGLEARDFSVQKESFRGDKIWVSDKLYILGGYLNPARKPLYESYWSELSFEQFDSSKSGYSVGDRVEFNAGLYELRYEGYSPSESTGISPDTTYWVLISELFYSQDESYEPGDIVKYKGLWFECEKENGDILSDVVQPFANPWVNLNLVDYTTIVTPDEGDLGIDTGDDSLVEYVSGSWEPKQFFDFEVDKDFKITDYVRYSGAFYQSKIDIVGETGLHFVPGLTQFWSSVSFDDWGVGTDYSGEAVGLIVDYNGTLYELYNLTNIQTGITPNQALANWRVFTINAYDPEITYQADEYVELDGDYYQVPAVAVPYVNAATFDNDKVEFTQIADPRNKILKTCMAHISLHSLHMRIAPDNVPQHRVRAYEKTLKDLKCYSDFSKDPGIPRKVGSNGKTSSDWVVGAVEGGNDTEWEQW